MTTIAPPAPSLNLSDLSSRIDIQGFYESHGCVIAGKPSNSRKDGKEWAGSCPHCPGSTDRFHFWESGRFSCSLRSSGCGWHGSSPYWFLRDQGYDHQQALLELGIDPSEVDSYSQKSGNRLPLEFTKDEAPCKVWQDSAHAFCQAAERCLWSSKGESARKYLQSRGFTDQTIRTAHLGLCPDWYKAPLSDWGLDASQLNKTEDPQIKIPRGIVIPWFVDGAIWKIQIRRPEPGPTGKYYFEVTGSSDALYNIDSLRPGQPVLLVESELDARSAEQEAGELVACIATGSTAKGRASRWIGRLKLASQVLQSFDIDENMAGERGADEWLKALPNAMRWTPWSHDVNDMLREGQSIRDWVEMGLILSQSEGPFSAEELEQAEVLDFETLDQMLTEAFAHPPEAIVPPALDKNGKEVPPELVERVAAFQSGAGCIGCGGNDWMLDPYDGKLICPCLMKKREENLRLASKSLPILKRVPDGALVDLELDAQRIAEVEHLPIGQARYWARTRAHLESVGYYDQVARERVVQQARIAVYREQIGRLDARN